ncbi:thioesterase [Taibaiella sp. KBW10]|uniref:acyl-CoA thioesterase n=1 Tax=Taibaiella sp. KBW10 TaxID=2153357 RepID=UPI000F5A090F|nr:acyl-CoA thioesterase [Taibaiella sp. KBW10]RQO32585.1 thioesterase [Taibaiella sp. KBW10]
MDNIVLTAKVMWSQLDANMHLRHSAYADFAAQARLELMDKMQFGFNELARLRIGPVLFREELQYLKEIRPNETLQISCLLKSCRADGSRWSFLQKVYRTDGAVAAIIHADGAWIDLDKRKLTGLPEAAMLRFMEMPKTEDFVLEPNKIQQS